MVNYFKLKIGSSSKCLFCKPDFSKVVVEQSVVEVKKEVCRIVHQQIFLLRYCTYCQQIKQAKKIVPLFVIILILFPYL